MCSGIIDPRASGSTAHPELCALLRGVLSLLASQDLSSLGSPGSSLVTDSFWKKPAVLWASVCTGRGGPVARRQTWSRTALVAKTKGPVGWLLATGRMGPSPGCRLCERAVRVRLGCPRLCSTHQGFQVGLEGAFGIVSSMRLFLLLYFLTYNNEKTVRPDCRKITNRFATSSFHTLRKQFRKLTQKVEFAVGGCYARYKCCYRRWINVWTLQMSLLISVFSFQRASGSGRWVSSDPELWEMIRFAVCFYLCVCF